MASVAAWVGAYQTAVAAATTKMRAENCIPPSADGSGAAAPTIIIAGNQPVTVSGGSGGAPMVIAPTPPTRPALPPPPPVVAPPTPRVEVNPADPLVDLSDNSRNSVLREVLDRFHLPFQRASSFKSPLFIKTVKDFQRCIARPKPVD